MSFFKELVLSNDILVDVQDLHFNYDGRPVLQGINMTIPRGKVVAIMGGSGCGKTTLLRCIGGQLRPTGGMVRLEKHRVCEMLQTELYGLRRVKSGETAAWLPVNSLFIRINPARSRIVKGNRPWYGVLIEEALCPKS